MSRDNSDATYSIGQLELVARAARLLANNGLVIYGCHYDFNAFGSWTVEAGAATVVFEFCEMAKTERFGWK